jgi:CRISPR-associated protein (TIGR03984 family)
MNHEYTSGQRKSLYDVFTDLSKTEELIKTFENARAVAWYYDEIVFYRIENSTWNKEMKGLDELVRLRIFDEEKELHVWLSNGQLKSRLRTDSIGEGTQFVDSRLVLNGTSFERMNHGVVATEDKGIRYELPYPKFEILVGENSQKKRVAIITRNYIDHNEIGQAGYVDCRFLDFEIF